ncbi:hypothetical protein D6C83_03220, partial [Aureobasidium pullulans]
MRLAPKQRYFGFKGGWLVFWITVACATDMTLFGYDQGVFSGVVVSDDFLELHNLVGPSKTKEEHEPQSEASNTINLPVVTVGDSTQNILDGPAGRPFIKLASRPGPDSLDAFNLIMAKITAQSISTSNAMLPHIIFKISKHPVTRATNPDTMKNATTAELFDTICPRLEVGNQFHTAFKRVGRTTLYGMERLEALNEEWQKLWLEGLKDFEPMTIWLTTKHIKMGLQNLDGTPD